MLFLLKSPAGGAVAATCSLSLGLSAVAGATAACSLTLGLTPPESVELNVFVTPSLTLGLVAIPVGFLTRSAPATLQLPLNAAGGFGDSPTLTLALGLSGTVGSFLDGIATATLVLGLTGSAVSVPNSPPLTLQLGLLADPSLSGGTLTPSATADLTLSLAGIPVTLGQGLCDLTLDLLATGTFTVLTGVVETIRFEHLSRRIRFTHL